VLDFRILGSLEVADDGRPIRLGGPKQRATLAILLLNANRVVSAERLADDLYAGNTPVTAMAQVQRQISELRKALASADAILTRPPGYVIAIAPEQLDLTRFEATVDAASRASSRGDPQRARDLLREALAAWRGAPLADLADEAFAQVAIGRLEEIRLAALEQRIDADLALGRQPALVGELEQLVREHPLRETLRAQLMLAYYRTGRQVEALETYRRTRDMLVSNFGIEPSPSLQQLERAILQQDPALEVAASGVPADPRGHGPVLVLPSGDAAVERLLAIAEPLAALPGRALILARLVSDGALLGATVAALNRRRAAARVPFRTAAFTTPDRAADAVRLASVYDAELVLVDGCSDSCDGAIPPQIAAIFERSPADVGWLVGTPEPLSSSATIFMPFGGGEHDWAALEASALVCKATGSRLRLVGTDADPASGRRDASRLLADASLALQRVVDVEADPMLVPPDTDALVAAIQPAALVVMGVSPRWRSEGQSSASRALLATRKAALLIHGGPRPGALAPRASRTRFTWSL
jgi:DNA-binding SARP family transcriptional activator